MKSRSSNIYKKRIVKSVAILAVLLSPITVACSSLRAAVPQAGCYKRKGLEPKIQTVIEEFRASVPAIMKKGKVPGAAIALVDDKGIIWTEGFGYTDGKRKTHVTPDTLFLINGMSKIVTATAIMLAIQDGVADLDEPITTYLPDFEVNSRYEEHSARKITLRHLLSNTTGLPNETPLGNNFEPSSMASFEDHVKSIFGTWLRFPVGNSFSHSDVSSDLAAYTIQVMSGQPFEQYMKERLFTPLGMSNSTIDREQILKTTNRAVGNMMGISKMPAVYPALAAGGVYSTARDMARFIRLHINKGTLDGKRLLDESLIEAIHRPKGIVGDPNVYYGLGICIDKRAPERVDLILHHDGSGFGFLSFMHWYPEYGIGTIALTNKLPNPILGELALTLTDRLIKEKIVEKRFPQPKPELNKCVSAFWGWPGHHIPTPYKREWRKYCGNHSLRFSGYKLKWWAELAVLILGRDKWTPRIKVQEKDGFLCVTESKFFEQIGILRHINERLQEVKPGLFFAGSGISLDFTSEVPTWRNYRLKKR